MILKFRWISVTEQTARVTLTTKATLCPAVLHSIFFFAFCVVFVWPKERFYFIDMIRNVLSNNLWCFPSAIPVLTDWVQVD